MLTMLLYLSVIMTLIPINLTRCLKEYEIVQINPIISGYFILSKVLSNAVPNRENVNGNVNLHDGENIIFNLTVHFAAINDALAITF